MLKKAADLRGFGPARASHVGAKLTAFAVELPGRRRYHACLKKALDAPLQDRVKAQQASP